MALYIRTLSIEALLPIQAIGVGAANLKVLASLNNLPPVETVLFDAERGSHLLVDGHHRAVLALQRQEGTVKAYSAIDDSGIVDLDSAALHGLYTMSSVHRAYRQRWQPGLERAGIVSIATLPVYP